MGISSKIWSLEFMRWILGNRLMQCPFGGRAGAGEIIKRSKSNKRREIKVIRAEYGVVNIYSKGIQVSEVVMEFPKHMVCKSDSFYIGQMIPPLSNKYRLQSGETYFLLPNHLFESALSFLTLTSFIASAKSQSHVNKVLLNSQPPFHIQKTPSGYLRVNVSEDFISQLMIISEVPQTPPPPPTLCTTNQLQKDYQHLVTPRTWKPKLETINENKKTLKKKKKKNPKPIGIIQYSSSSSSVCSSKHNSRNKIKTFLATRRKRKQQQ